MKRAGFWMSFVVCVLVLSAACGSSQTDKASEVSEAGQAVQQFYGHLNRGEYAAAMDLYAASVRDGFLGPDGSIDESFSTWAGGETRAGTVAEVKIGGEEIDEAAGTGTVRFELLFPSGKPERRTVSMTREDGQWKLGFIDQGD